MSWSVCHVEVIQCVKLVLLSLSCIGLWCRESCYGQCVVLVLCMVSVLHRIVMQRVLLWSVCHVGSLYGQCLSSVCGAESPVMVSVSCWFSVWSCSALHRFVVQRVLLWSVCDVGFLYGQCLSSVCGAESPVMVSVSCWFSVWSCSAFHRFVVQRVLLWSVCDVGSLYGQCLSSVCGAESPVMVSVSCGDHAVHHVGSLVSVFHLFVVREPCRGHCHFGCGQCVMSWSCIVSCWFSGQCLASVCGVRESCSSQCVML